MEFCQSKNVGSLGLIVVYKVEPLLYSHSWMVTFFLQPKDSLHDIGHSIALFNSQKSEKMTL